MHISGGITEILTFGLVSLSDKVRLLRTYIVDGLLMGSTAQGVKPDPDYAELIVQLGTAELYTLTMAPNGNPTHSSYIGSEVEAESILVMTERNPERRGIVVEALRRYISIENKEPSDLAELIQLQQAGYKIL